MGFTRSITETDVHQNMPDYPSSEGITTEQLKTAFDAPATGLKTDLNGLMTELEASDSSASLGAAALSAGDTSDANVQAKLAYLLGELEGIALGDIPDGTITQGKLDDDYEATLAKKDGTLQTGLNAEKLGGTTLAGIQALITAQSHEKGTFTVSYSEGDQNTKNHTLTLGYAPSMVVYLKNNTTAPGIAGFPIFGVIIGSIGMYFDKGNDKWVSFNAEASSTSVTIKGFCVKAGSNTYTHNMSYFAVR